MSSRRLLGAILLAGLLVGCSKGPPGTPDVGPPEVTVAHPAVELLTETTDMTGMLDNVDFVQLRPRVSGFILDVTFKDGDLVKMGDVLVLIDPAPYEAIYKQNKAQLSNYEAQLKLAESELARNFKLLNTGGVSREEYDRTVAQKSVAVAGIEGATAALARAKLDLDWTKVTAPITGRTDRAYLTKGNVVTGGLSQGTILTTIVSTEKIYAYFDVNEQIFDYYQQQLKDGRFAPDKEGVEVFLGLQGDNGLYPHKGKINFVANRFSPSTGSLQLRAVVDHPSKEMIAGRQVKARVPISNPYPAVLIPDEAILSDQGARFVYVVDKDKKVRTRVVTIGPMAYGLRVIADGFKVVDGKVEDLVVIKGQQRIRPDVLVKPLESKAGIQPVKPGEARP